MKQAGEHVRIVDREDATPFAQLGSTALVSVSSCRNDAKSTIAASAAEPIA